DNFYVAFVDLGATYRSFERSALARSERPARSLMPSYADAFSARELDDLVAYLASLGGGENAR
ncbi:MAG: hypothetical protein KDC27_18245, partial [Acidobacteria bacterium]|nr:hypothetical protein [Acidobacteriota bacterium]